MAKHAETNVLKVASHTGGVRFMEEISKNLKLGNTVPQKDQGPQYMGHIAALNVENKEQATSGAKLKIVGTTVLQIIRNGVEVKPL